MWSLVSDYSGLAITDLLIAGAMAVAYGIAKQASQRAGAIATLWKAAICCGILAFMAAAPKTIAANSCNGLAHPIHSGCFAQSNISTIRSGGDVSGDLNIGELAYFLLILFVPAASGAFDGGKRRVEPDQ